MSATDLALGVSFYAAKPPSDVDALAEAILSFYDAIGRPPHRLVLLHRDGQNPADSPQ